MKIAFLTPSVSRALGGIFEIERRLAQCLASINSCEVTAFGLRDQYSEQDVSKWVPVVPRVLSYRGPASFGYSPSLAKEFIRCGADIGHLHALWMFTSIVMDKWSQSAGKPYIVTPNGMLERWSLLNSRWKKTLAAALYERKMLRNAACLQANTEKEAADFRAFGLRNPIAIIPNGIDLPDEAGAPVLNSASLTNRLKASGRKVLLYLGRIHPKKGLVDLLRAWARVQCSPFRVQGPEWVLLIAGWDQNGHEGELKRLATELGLRWADIRSPNPSTIYDQRLQPFEGLQSSIIDHQLSTTSNSQLLFAGPQFGADKAACNRNCDAFILSSLSEGLPMVILEAWAYAKPVLMTAECNLPEGPAAGAALRIHSSASARTTPGRALSMDEGLRRMLALSEKERIAMGQRGRALVAERFTWPRIAAEIKAVYEWILGGGDKPAFVRVDL